MLSLHIRFPHAFTTLHCNFYNLPWVWSIKGSNKKSQHNAVNACRNRMCKRAFREKFQNTWKKWFYLVHEPKLENIKKYIIFRTQKVKKDLFYKLIVKNSWGTSFFKSNQLFFGKEEVVYFLQNGSGNQRISSFIANCCWSDLDNIILRERESFQSFSITIEEQRSGDSNTLLWRQQCLS